MSPKKLAALVLTGCLMSTVGCAGTGGGGGGLFGGGNGCGGCCKHGGGGLFGRNNAAPAPVGVIPGGYPVTDCPCSYHGNSNGDHFHAAVLTQGVPTQGMPTTTPSGIVADGGPNCPVQQMPMQGSIQTFPGSVPVTTPGVPVAPPMGNPVPGPVPGNPPRIQPVPAAPGGMGMPPGAAPMGVAPMGGPPAAGGFAAPGPWGPQ